MDDSTSSLEQKALRLSGCIADSQGAYRSLLDLENQQAGLIESADIEGVANKIDEKKRLLDIIREKDDRLHQAHIEWQSVRDSAPAPLRERLQGQVEELQKTMGKLLEVQNRNEEKLTEHGKEISGKLAELQKRKSAHQGYQQQRAGDAYREAKFYDKNT